MIDPNRVAESKEWMASKNLSRDIKRLVHWVMNSYTWWLPEACLGCNRWITRCSLCCSAFPRPLLPVADRDHDTGLWVWPCGAGCPARPVPVVGRWPCRSGGTIMRAWGGVPEAEGRLGWREGPASPGQGCYSCRALPLQPGVSRCLARVLSGFCLQKVDVLLCFAIKAFPLRVCYLHRFNCN